MKATSKELFRQHSEHLCVHQLFERQAALTPSAVALVHENNQLTYEELNRRANQLAHYLRSLGVKVETPVGVYIDRSPEMLIGLLAILKAGGAYVPLDTNYPKGRISLILENSGLTHLLTNSRLWSAETLSSVQAVCLDLDKQYLKVEAGTQLPTIGSDERLAYIIYTSGSTGEPKGVEVRHRAVGNLLNSMYREPGIGPEDRLLAVTTLSFDISVLELFLPLTVGGCLILASEAAADPAKLAEQVICEDITVMQATPTLWQYLLDINWQGKRNLTVLCGGEVFPRRLVPELVSRSAAVWNMYGPTETTIWSSIYRVAEGEEGPVPIGRPIFDTQMHLLDDGLRAVSAAVPARLYIGGEGLARGYHKRPDLTAERFIPDPISVVPGCRIYDTGDIACRHSNGVVSYLGRADFQIKLRGVRIELGEIEATLDFHPGIRQSVTTVREDKPGDKRIVAYYVAASAVTPTATELRRHLRMTMPEQMVPSGYIRLDAFPLTANGKIDRAALPAPTMSGMRVGQQFVPPQTQFEKEVVAIWSGLLGFEDIGVHDYFLELGGHSLLVMQVISRVNDAFRVSLSISDVLTKGMTVTGLVTLIENALFEQADYEDFNEVVQELENLSDDEAKKRLLDA